MKCDNASDAILEVEAWATPAHDVSMDDLLAEFTTNGTPILEVDRRNNRVKVCHVRQHGLLPEEM